MDFNSALDFIFKKEGGYVNDPTDKGGETKFGISKKANPDVDVANLTKDKAAELYKARYWDPIGADTLPNDMKLAALDTAVQHGPDTARKLIEASGGNTAKLLADRAALYQSIVANDPTQAKFAKGWDNRLADVAQVTQQVAARDNTEKAVADMVQQKLGDNYILSKLTDAGHGDEIAYAQQQGFTPAEIVAKFGGASAAAVKQAQSDVAGQSFITNVGKGVGNAVDDVVGGAKQIGARMSGDDAKLAQLQAEERARQADPRYQAQQGTAGSAMGSFVTKASPYVGAAVLTGGAAIPLIAGQAAVGAAEGALTPTTGDDQFASNIGTGAVLSGATAAVPVVGGKLLSSALKAVRPSAAAADTAAERAAIAKARGWDTTPAMLNDTARSVQDALPGARAAADDAATKNISRDLLKGVGLEGDAVTPEAVATARANIYKQADEWLKDVPVSPRAARPLQGELDKIVADYERKTLPTYRSGEVKNIATDLIDKVKSGDMDAQGLVQARKNISNNAFKADADTRSALKAIQDVVDQHLGQVAPEAKAALDTANKQWQHLQVLEKVVEMTRGQPTLSPSQLATAVKTSSRDLFQVGKAPYQDLADDAIKLYGSNTSKGLSGLLSKAAGGLSDAGLTTAAFFEPVSALTALGVKKGVGKLAEKLVTSRNPTIVKALTGLDDGTTGATNSFIAKAVGSVVPSATDVARPKAAPQSALVAALRTSAEQVQKDYSNLPNKLLDAHIAKTNLSKTVRDAFEAERQRRTKLSAQEFNKFNR